MAATPRPTPIDKYALGRNSFVEIWFENVTAAGVKSDVGFSVCISEGSISLDTDTIEINSNCQNGWKVKLPGLKSGTASFTGYIASSIQYTPGPGMTENSATARNKYDILQYLGQTCYFYAHSLQNPDDRPQFFGEQTAGDVEVPFSLIPVGDAVAGTEMPNGFFKTGSVTISPDDAVKVSMSVELSGEVVVSGFIASGAMYPLTNFT